MTDFKHEEWTEREAAVFSADLRSWVKSIWKTDFVLVRHGGQTTELSPCSWPNSEDRRHRFAFVAGNKRVTHYKKTFASTTSTTVATSTTQLFGKFAALRVANALIRCLSLSLTRLSNAFWILYWFRVLVVTGWLVICWLVGWLAGWLISWLAD